MNHERILHVLGLVVLLAVVVPFAIYAVPGLIGAEQSYIILSGSMEPELSPGDAVIVADTPAENIEEGDVITFSRTGSDTVVTHRVVDVREENGQRLFETKGDANDQSDREPVPADDVVGSVTLTIPLIGHVVHFVNTPLGFATTVLLPLGLLAVSEAWTFARQALRDPVESVDGGTAVAGTASATGAGSAAERTTGGPDHANGASVGETDDATKDGEREAEEVDGTVVVDATDLVATTAVVALLAPYTVFVALQLRTMATIAIAYTTCFTAFALAAIQIVAFLRRRRDRRERSRAGAGDTGYDAGASDGERLAIGGAEPDDGAHDAVPHEAAHAADQESPDADASSSGDDEPDPEADERDADDPAEPTTVGAPEFEWGDGRDPAEPGGEER